MDQWTGRVAIKEVLSVELARVEERRAGLVLSLADGTILHIEFQSGDDKDMPYRQGICCLMLGQKYRRRVRQVVLYVREPKMRMKDHVDLGETKYTYTLMDIREIDALKLMERVVAQATSLSRCWQGVDRNVCWRSPSSPTS